MAYSNRTRFYRIPVMGYGDRMTEEQETIQMGLIDSLLYAACFGCSKAVLEEGAYSVEFNQEGTRSELVITPAVQSGGYSLMGLVNGRMFCSQEPVRAGAMIANMTYRVYAEHTDSLESNPAAFRIGLYLEQDDPPRSASRLPLCTVRNIPGAVVIDTDVDGKPHARNILAHTTDSTNPHGERLVQGDLDVVNSLTVSGAAVHGAVYGTYVTQPGEYQYEGLPQGAVPLFVHAYPESTAAGQVAWRISDGSVYLSNSGESGVTVNLKIETGTTA